ncbi:MAG TPA: lysophospholipid acyltransferase family protein [Bradyrhizobium sp.]|nr:lysophospholipid acyltransferase family protein [Bradyrhizobium sp.]
MKRLLRNALRSSWFQRAAGFLAAEFLRLVWLTNRFSIFPPDVYAEVEPRSPVILVFWHGQHFLTPFIRTKEIHRAKVLISLHRDGEFNAIAAERLGIGTIRGSGDHGTAFHRKGGVGAFREMVQALEDRWNVATTADVPKRARVVGMGLIMLARESGRPILPFAMATSRFVRLKNWDSSTINLPFGRGAVVGIDSVFVPPDADAETMERLRLQVETYLNEATRRAYAAVGRPEAALG